MPAADRPHGPDRRVAGRAGRHCRPGPQRVARDRDLRTGRLRGVKLLRAGGAPGPAGPACARAAEARTAVTAFRRRANWLGAAGSRRTGLIDAAGMIGACPAVPVTPRSSAWPWRWCWWR